ncbi:hypothetical protein FIU97_18860 (plasmid) [Roseivivax sp. THAF40]|uniref:CcdB family protein n=1 Tax=unclassified Roseivivax TaxID=2639302 RepID=UPI001267C7C7|nr:MULTISPECIES: CcdB family protein [unclassified Roseivivax]QFS84953.1 hypothetical protein FIV09_19080 [Roseivivax sp. THAF197b]QFT48654.1 hypothetical protein FIU97_18860 [Roseivivax sp. THAF40]
MSQGTIFQTRDGLHLVCRLQADLGIQTTYILCAPVMPRSYWGDLVPKLHVETVIAGAPYVILVSQMVALPASEIGIAVGSAELVRDELLAAADLLLHGFQ